MTDHDTIDYRNEHHVENLLNWLLDIVGSAGGDGDAIWYSLFYDVREILPIVEKLNKKVKWEIELKEKQDGRYIAWWSGQECILITNSETMWNQRPSWQQCSIQF